MNVYDNRPDYVAEILTQFILLERSKDWLESQIQVKLNQIDVAEQSEEADTMLLQRQLKQLYHRCSFEKREMDKFMEKYGHAIPVPTGAS